MQFKYNVLRPGAIILGTFFTLIAPLIAAVPLAQVQEKYQQASMAAVFTTEEREAISRRGAVIYLPVGGNDDGLLSEMRAIGILPACAVLDKSGITAQSLKGRNLLVLPDFADWDVDAARDSAIVEFVRDGGGVYALGNSIELLQRLGVADVDLQPFWAEGNTYIDLAGETALLNAVIPVLDPLIEARALRGDVKKGYSVWFRNGPLFEPKPNSNLKIRGRMWLTTEGFARSHAARIRSACIATGTYGKGRLVLVSGRPTGMTCKDNPVDGMALAQDGEITAENISDLIPRVVQKSLLMFAAGENEGAPAPNMPSWGTQVQGSVALNGSFQQAKGAFQCRIKGSFEPLPDLKPRHVFHFWADPLNRIDATYSPLESRLEIVWTGDGLRAILLGHDIYWQGKEWHHLALAWEPGATKSTQKVALYIDGVIAHMAEAAPALGAEPVAMKTGAVDMGVAFDGALDEISFSPEPVLDLQTVAAKYAGIVDGPTWDETPQELTELRRSNETKTVAYLAHVRGAKGVRQAGEGKETIALYDIPMKIVGPEALANGWLAANKPSVIFGPGGGAVAVPQAVHDNIRQSVEQGAGYYGICAGMNYGLVGSVNGPKLLPATIQKYGGLQKSLCTFDPKHPIFHNVESVIPGRPDTLYMTHYSGPTILNTEGIAPIVMFDQSPYVAALAGLCGKGRVVTSSPHPELDVFGNWRASTKNLLQMKRVFRNSLYFAAGTLETPQK